MGMNERSDKVFLRGMILRKNKCKQDGTKFSGSPAEMERLRSLQMTRNLEKRLEQLKCRRLVATVEPTPADGQLGLQEAGLALGTVAFVIFVLRYILCRRSLPTKDS